MPVARVRKLAQATAFLGPTACLAAAAVYDDGPATVGKTTPAALLSPATFGLLMTPKLVAVTGLISPPPKAGLLPGTHDGCACPSELRAMWTDAAHHGCMATPCGKDLQAAAVCLHSLLAILATRERHG